MDETALIVILVVAAIVIVGVAWWLSTRRRRDLHDRFGPEYDRTVEDADSRRAAERELREREERRQGLDIVPLDDHAAAYYATEWQGIQQRFVDAPSQSVAEADVLVMRVMRDRGYPMDDFERQAANVSVDHPDVVDHYRSGHAIAERSHTEECDTEELREAVVHYRALFESLLEDRDDRDSADPGSTDSPLAN